MITSDQIKKEWKEEASGSGWYQNPVTKLWLRLGNGVSLVSIQVKYTGTLVINKNDVQIRIGCETHPVAQWEAHGSTLAKRHKESQWWDKTGKNMLIFLISEANLYGKKYQVKKPLRDSSGRFVKAN